MKLRHLSLFAISPLLFTACASQPSAEQQARFAEDAKQAVGRLIQGLGGELRQAMGQGGPVGAISVCKDKAPRIAATVSAETGTTVRRVTTRARNPASRPDAWEAAVLQDFEARLAQGATPDSLVRQEVVQDSGGRSLRYMKGLVVQEICMTCHGTEDTIPAEVRAKLAAEYPGDQATGYRPGMLRGAVSVRRPL